MRMRARMIGTVALLVGIGLLAAGTGSAWNVLGHSALLPLALTTLLLEHCRECFLGKDHAFRKLLATFLALWIARIEDGEPAVWAPGRSVFSTHDASSLQCDATCA